MAHIVSICHNVQLSSSVLLMYVCVCLQGVLSLLGQVEKAAEEKQEKDPDNQAKITEALEAVKGIRSIAPLVPDLVSREPLTA